MQNSSLMRKRQGFFLLSQLEKVVVVVDWSIDRENLRNFNRFIENCQREKKFYLKTFHQQCWCFYKYSNPTRLFFVYVTIDQWLISNLIDEYFQWISSLKIQQFEWLFRVIASEFVFQEGQKKNVDKEMRKGTSCSRSINYNRVIIICGSSSSTILFVGFVVLKSICFTENSTLE